MSVNPAASASTSSPSQSLAASALSAAKEAYIRRNSKSLAHYESEETQKLPGGSTRNTLVNMPFPLFIQKGVENRLIDIDGHEYIDVFGDATAGIYGHSHPVIHKAISSALSLGLNLGAHNLMEAKFAGAVCSRFNLDHVRFCNSGTEGNLMAIQTARIVTGRKKVFVFEGCYHGATFIFRNGPHPISIPYEYVMGTYNDVEGTRKLLREHAQDIACVTLEAMLGGGGCVPATKEFVQMLREETEKLGVCLIFDEVMTNRLSPSGIAGVFGIKPDMIALGKSVGGGLSFGGWGGSKKYLGRYDTRLPVEQQIPHAGTFNNASLQMTTGYAGLTEAYTPEACQKLNAYGDQLRAKLNAVAVKHGAPLLFTGIGSMIGTHFTDKKEVKTLADLRTSSLVLRELLFFDLNEAGIWASKGGTMNLSLPFLDRPEDGEMVVREVDAWLGRRRNEWMEFKRGLERSKI